MQYWGNNLRFLFEERLVSLMFAVWKKIRIDEENAKKTRFNCKVTNFYRRRNTRYAVSLLSLCHCVRFVVIRALWFRQNHFAGALARMVNDECKFDKYMSICTICKSHTNSKLRISYCFELRIAHSLRLTLFIYRYIIYFIKEYIYKEFHVSHRRTWRWFIYRLNCMSQHPRLFRGSTIGIFIATKKKIARIINNITKSIF